MRDEKVNMLVESRVKEPCFFGNIMQRITALYRLFYIGKKGIIIRRWKSLPKITFD